jgi:hypothetical protein
MARLPLVLLKRVSEGWRGAKLSRVALGKYIVLFASLLHVAWAGLLVFSADAAKSTPVAVISSLCGGRYRAAFVLIVFAVAAMTFPFFRRRITSTAMAGLLIPQQFLLLMSAGAGVWAAVQEKYADGVVRGWPFILSDQLPSILLALLYTVAVVESAFEPDNRVLVDVPEEEVDRAVSRGESAWTP